MAARLAEMVEEEAARAETEEPDEEEEETEEPEPEPEPEPEEPEQGQLGAIGPEELGKAERAIAAQRKRLAGILGDAYVAQDCPMCSALGFVPELPPPGTEFQLVPDEQGSPTLLAIPPRAAEYRQASDKETCPECDGRGQTLTGAKPPAQELWQCGACQGSGWIQKGALVVSSAQAVAATPGPPMAPGAPLDGVGLDAWGREPGHKHWGVPPNMIPG